MVLQAVLLSLQVIDSSKQYPTALPRNMSARVSVCADIAQNIKVRVDWLIASLVGGSGTAAHLTDCGAGPGLPRRPGLPPTALPQRQRHSQAAVVAHQQPATRGRELGRGIEHMYVRPHQMHQAQASELRSAVSVRVW